MNGLFGCNSCSWVLILVIIFLLCQNGECGNNCGCGNNGSIGGSNSGCGCDNDCGCGDYHGCGCGCN